MSGLIEEVARLRAENDALKAERDNWRKQALEEDALVNHLTVKDYVIGQLVISRNGEGITLGDVRVRILNTVGGLDGNERIMCDCILSNVADAVHEMKGQLEVIKKMSSETVADNIGESKANPDANRVKVNPSEYQLLARQFARGGGETLVYAILGMMEELGELVGKLRFEKMENSPYHPLLSDASSALSAIKRDGEYAGRIAKFIRKNWGELSVSTREKLISVTEESGYSKEVGDMAWMLAGICSSLGLKLENVMDENIRKLEDRAKRGVIVGSGDNR